MKRTTAILIIFTTVLCDFNVCSSSSQMPEAYLVDNFERYAEGSFTDTSKWVIFNKSESGGIINITQDKAVEIGNDGTASVDPFIQSKRVCADGTLFVSFDITVNKFTTGNFTLCLRNGSSSGSYEPFYISSSGKAQYLFRHKDFVKESDFTEGTKVNVSMILETNTGRIVMYENGVKKAEISNFRQDSNSVTLNDFSLRFYVANWRVGNKYSIVLDNIYMTMLEGDEFKTGNISLFYNNGVDILKYIHKGPCKIAFPLINDSGSDTVTSVISAVYDKTGVLQNIKLAEADFKTGDVIIPQICMDFLSGDDIGVIKCLVLDGTDNIRPLTKVREIHPLCYTNLSERLITDDVKVLYNLNCAGARPRIMATQDTFARITANDNLTEWKNNIIAQADVWCSKDMSNTFGYNITGGRLLSISRNVKNALEALAMSYHLTGNSKYLKKACAIMEQVAAFPNWNPSHLLDTAEMSAGIAIGYDWLYNSLTESQRKTIEEAILNHALIVAQRGYASNAWWTRETVNRNIVHNGGFIMGALSVADIYPDIAFDIVKNAIYCLGYMLPSFAPDGAWDEGVGYAIYTLEYLAKTYSTLEAALGSDMGLSEVAGINKINYFLFHSSSINGRNNFHDDGASSLGICPEMLYIARIFGDDTAVAKYMEMKNLSGATAKVEDLLWYSEPIEDSITSIPLDGYFRGAEFVAMRDAWGNANRSYLSFHGGKNYGGNGHYHIDAGTFVLDLAGVRWAEDLGTDNLTYGTVDGSFDGDRSVVYRVRAEGHNTIVINPDESGGQDDDTDAKVIEIDGNEDYAYAVLDLSSAYKTHTNSVKRKYSLINNRSEAVIEDEIILKQQSDIYWFMHTKASAQVTENGILLTKDGKNLLVTIECSTEADISVADALHLIYNPDYSNQADNSSYKKIQIKMEGSGLVALRVKFTPINI